MRKWVFFITILCGACLHQPQAEYSVFFKNNTWETNEPLTFDFNINDTSQDYNLFFLFKHNNLYHYKNIWLQVTLENNLKKSRDSFLIEIPLAEDGKGWLGTSFNNIVNHKILMHTQPLYFNNGINHFTITQIMRENPLENVISAGIQLKKINKQ